MQNSMVMFAISVCFVPETPFLVNEDKQGVGSVSAVLRE